MVISNGLAILFLASMARAWMATGQASNFNVSEEVALTYGCNETCQKVLSLTNAADLKTLGTAFDFDFYATADNFSASVPGDLLKLGAINSSNLDVPAGMTTFRFQYTSRDLDGSPVPSTGFIAFPYAKPAHGGKIPLVAFAHGTIGVYRGCAPSSSPDVFNYDSWTPLIFHGYAAHANDLYYSVQAARKTFPGVFTEEWMSIGHSQGGGAVWKLSEHPLVQNASSGYLGTIAVSPGAKLYDTAKVVFDSILPRPDFHQFVVSAEMGPLAYGVMQVFPNYTTPWLGNGMIRRLGLTTLLQSCTLAFMGMSFDLPREELIALDANPAADETLKQFQAINAPAQGDPASRPILVIQGWNDTSILPETTVAAYQDAVAAGNEVHLLRYPGLDHSATITASAPAWLKFLDDQFAHKPGCGASTDVTVQPFDLTVAKTPLELPLNEEPLLGFLRY
ncbi:Alpha/Beta hydrolase protein [Talaromyces proteolyticus]|uniref:Alpha/Beta hydrolase protein n=1 Tax=Talaromyces proteolyticus TaxID=1131652 RepID=A0AAD4L724_9EURO|nr:Alpha/Beta hydrolase protein [Talaromyces proteolyticus]KAH8705785.1 Alpha/Beta hydrolase protein [Talaromyces proteolyticus]